MSGLVTKAQMLAVTMLFAATLMATTVNMFFLTTQYARDLVERYETAVTTQTGSTWRDLSNQEKISYASIFKILYSSTDTFEDCTLVELDGSTKNITYSSMYYLLRNAQKYAKVTVDYPAGKISVTLTEVE